MEVVTSPLPPVPLRGKRRFDDYSQEAASFSQQQPSTQTSPQKRRRQDSHLFSPIENGMTQSSQMTTISNQNNRILELENQLKEQNSKHKAQLNSCVGENKLLKKAVMRQNDIQQNMTKEIAHLHGAGNALLEKIARLEKDNYAMQIHIQHNNTNSGFGGGGSSGSGMMDQRPPDVF